MKPQKLNFSLILTVFTLIFTLNSCVKDSPILPTSDRGNEINFSEITTSSPKIANDVSSQNGVLNFKSTSDFRSTLLALNRMSSNEQAQWEEELGFNSMQQIFNAIVRAEYETVGVHSSLYQSNLEAGLISPNETSGLYVLNLFNPAYATVLNKDGLVVIANDIYLFSEKALKIWENGDANQLEVLQNTSESSNEIQVIPMNYQEVVLRNTSTWSKKCVSSDGTRKLKLKVSYNSGYLDPGHPETVFIDYFITAISKVKDANGKWQYDPDATVRLKGKSQIDFTVTDGENERTRTLMKSYEQIYGYGGSFTFIPDENGDYNFGAPWNFANPANLMRANWVVLNRFGDGRSFSCELSY